MSNFSRFTNQLYDILNDHKVAVTCILTAGLVILYFSTNIDFLENEHTFMVDFYSQINMYGGPILVMYQYSYSPFKLDLY